MIKRNLISIAAGAAVVLGAASACQQEIESESPAEVQKVKAEIEATIADGRGSKTIITDEGKVLWKPDDIIAVSFGRHLMYFRSYNLEPAPVAKFVGEALVTIGGNEGSTGSSEGYTYWGVYPGYGYGEDEYDGEGYGDFDYSAGRDKDEEGYTEPYYPVTDGKSVTTTLSSWQQGIAGSFDDDLFITLAKSEDYRQLSFYNVCGGVRFSLEEEGVKTVTFSGNDGEPLAGRVKLVMDSEDRPVVSDFVNEKRYVTLALPDGKTFIPGEWYYIVTLPATLSKGYTMTLSKGDYTSATLTCTDPVEIRRSAFASLKAADDTLSYLRASEPTANQIFYESINGQAIDFSGTVFGTARLIGNDYLGGYGVLTFDGPVEAIADNAFYNNSNLRSVYLPAETQTIGASAFYSADNLETIHMGGVRTIGSQSFSGCSKLSKAEFGDGLSAIGYEAFAYSSLKSVTVPASVRSLGEAVFYNCDSLVTAQVLCSAESMSSLFSCCDNLESVSFSGSAKSFSCFYRCTSLKSVTFPSGITSLGGFGGCTSLVGVDIPATVTMLVDNCFDGCSALKSVSLPDSLTYIENYCFWNCTSLDSIAIPRFVTTLESSTFEGCSSLKSVSLPKGLKNVDSRAFYGCSALKRLDFHNPSLQITSEAFCNCYSLQDVYFHSKSVSYLTWNAFQGCPSTLVIHVPATVVDTYRSGWAGLASYLGRDINDLIIGEEALVPRIAGYEYVDLGLSTLWATCNLGASDPEETGDWFCWGATEPDTVKYMIDSTTYSKYVCDTTSEYYDGKIILEPCDDAATVNWGGTWRTPTWDEYFELDTKCTWKWTTRNGVNGYLVTGPSGDSIFLPASYYMTTESLVYYAGCYVAFNLNSSERYYVWVYRYGSTLVRPVATNPDYNSGSSGTK